MPLRVRIARPFGLIAREVHVHVMFLDEDGPGRTSDLVQPLVKDQLADDEIGATVHARSIGWLFHGLGTGTNINLRPGKGILGSHIGLKKFERIVWSIWAVEVRYIINARIDNLTLLRVVDVESERDLSGIAEAGDAFSFFLGVG